jgi:hypothetical protein
MQTEIMTNGPLAAAFNVFADFPAYKSGVYVHRWRYSLHVPLKGSGAFHYLLLRL